MIDLVLIAAVGEGNFVIGRGNDLPWKPIPGDFQRFKTLTLDHPIIMGRRTYDSIISRNGGPLPRRQNIVVSKYLSNSEGIHVCRSLDDAEKLAETFGNRVYIIGGQQIYAQTISCAQKLELTLVHGNYEGDTFFPHISNLVWQEKNRICGELCDFITYVRK